MKKLLLIPLLMFASLGISSCGKEEPIAYEDHYIWTSFDDGSGQYFVFHKNGTYERIVRGDVWDAYTYYEKDGVYFFDSPIGVHEGMINKVMAKIEWSSVSGTLTAINENSSYYKNNFVK